MRGNGNANCSEMVTTLLTIVLYVSQLALLLEGYIQRLDRLKHFLHFKLT